MKLVWVLMVVVACKGKGSAPTAGSASGSPVAVVTVVGDAAVTVDAAVALPKGVLEFDTASDDVALATAFDNKVPELPALSADGKLLAEYFSGAGGPMPVPPMSVSITPIVGEGKSESLEIVNFKDVESIADPFETTPPKPAFAKQLKERGAAIMKRLDGFQSLVSVEMAGNELPRTTKVGDLTFKGAASEDGEAVLLTLTNAAGKVVRRATASGFSHGSGDDQCNFRPVLDQLYTDQAKTRVYVEIRFRFRDDCGEQSAQYIVWEMAGEDPDPSAAFAKDAVQIDRSTVAPATAKPETGTDVVATPSADGKSAWASLNAAGGERASYVLAMTPDGWRVIAVTSTKPVANAAANKDAKAGKLLPPPAFTAEAGDEALRAAFAKLTTDGIKAPPGELIAFGSGPGERTTTGAVLAKGWNAAWKGKTTVTSSIARLAPSGTTGWVAANIELAKGTYKIPFHIFAVFDKASSGEWTLVHLHFSV